MNAVPLIALLAVTQIFSASAFAQAAKPAPKAAVPSKEVAAPKNDSADLAFGAYQRGYYLTAFNEATKRVDEKQDPKAMTLLAELYANGFGVKRDDAKAAEWYRLAADRGDREAMFALAMFRIGGRGGAKNRDEAVKLLAAAAKLGHVAAAYDLALLYIEGQQFPQDFARAGIAAPGRECRKSGSAIRARDLLQGGPRRAEGRARGRQADGRRRLRGQSRRPDRILDRAL